LTAPPTEKARRRPEEGPKRISARFARRQRGGGPPARAVLPSARPPHAPAGGGISCSGISKAGYTLPGGGA